MEAVCFSIDKKGYIIVNVKDLSIPELSPENDSPFKNISDNYIYNGPLSYMIRKGDDITDLRSGKQVNKNDIVVKYKKYKMIKLKKERQ